MEQFRAALAEGDDWLAVCRSSIERLGTLPRSSNLGFVYVTDALAGSLDLIVEWLRAASGVRDWIGAGGAGICASGQERFEGGAMVALVVALPQDSFRLLVHEPGQAVQRPHAVRALDTPAAVSQAYGLGVVHAGPQQADVAGAIAALSDTSGAFLVGGLSSAGDLQVAGRATEGGLSGVLIDAAVPVITGLSQGCSPIGPVHEVTEGRGPWIKSLDGRSAMSVLKQDVGEVLARDLRRIEGFVHAALPLTGSDRADYLVRNLLGVDPQTGMVAVGDTLRRGDRLMFVKRDGSSAQTDLRRMVQDLLRRAEGRDVRGALYHSCIARGPGMFGPDSAELRMIEEILGPVPLAGFFTNGEIFHDRLYTFTGVLTLFL